MRECRAFYRFLQRVGLLLVVTAFVGVCGCSMFCCAMLYVQSGFEFILIGKRDLVAFLGLSSWCLVVVVWLSLAVSALCDSGVFLINSIIQ